MENGYWIPDFVPNRSKLIKMVQKMSEIVGNVPTLTDMVQMAQNGPSSPYGPKWLQMVQNYSKCS